MIDDLIKETKAYKKVIDHRAFCDNWLEGCPCVYCWGGGLIRFSQEVILELKKNGVLCVEDVE